MMDNRPQSPVFDTATSGLIYVGSTARTAEATFAVPAKTGARKRVIAMNEFDKTGYLGDGIRQFQHSTLDSFKQLFALCKEVCGFARAKILPLKGDRTNGQTVLACCLFVKILNGVEATHILSTYGLTHEGRIILRSALEGFFFLRATTSDAAFVTEFIKADEVNRLKLMRAARKYDKSPFLEIRQYATNEVIQAQEEKIEKEEIEEVNVWNVAQKYGLQHIYDSHYRLLSADIHVTARSMEQYMRTGATGSLESIDWGPQSEDVDQNLSLGIDILVRSLACMDGLFGIGIADELKTYTKRLETIQEGQD